MQYKAQVHGKRGWHTLTTEEDSDKARRAADAHSHKLCHQGTCDADIRVIDTEGNVYMWWMWWPVFEVIGHVDEYEPHADQEHYQQVAAKAKCVGQYHRIAAYVRDNHTEEK